MFLLLLIIHKNKIKYKVIYLLIVNTINENKIIMKDCIKIFYMQYIKIFNQWNWKSEKKQIENIQNRNSQTKDN